LPPSLANRLPSQLGWAQVMVALFFKIKFLTSDTANTVGINGLGGVEYISVSWVIYDV
jgi:hypothetical protein